MTATATRGRLSEASPRPKLTIGLPVYNGERFIAESLDALLAQTFTDFELIISDNASTDGTAEICRKYAELDSRVRYIRQPLNIGSAPNHNAVFRLARGTYFKWASDDDLYAPELLRRCVEELEKRPEVVLCHAWEAFIDESGSIIRPVTYRLNTADPSAPERLRSLLYVSGGDDIYGVIRVDVLNRTIMHGSYHNADRAFVAELALHGPFYQVPEVLYFRRDHPDRAERASDGKRSRAANLDPRRADRLRNPMLRLHAEYILGYVGAIRRAPLSSRDRIRCLAHIARWALSHLQPGSARRLLSSPDPAVLARAEKALAEQSIRAARIARLTQPTRRLVALLRRKGGEGGSS